MKAGRKSTDDQVMKRRAIVSEMYLTGKTQAEISVVVGVSSQQVSSDLKRIRETWRSSTLRDFDALKDLELARIDQVEVESWEGWRRTIWKHTVTRNEAGQGVNGEISKTVTTTEKLAGDPRFLDAILRCVERRCKILGLDAPTKVDGRLGLTLEDLLAESWHSQRERDTPSAGSQLEAILENSWTKPQEKN